MYTLSDLARGASDPRAAAREINRIIHTRAGSADGNPNGVSIFSKEWDNLIILDSCRLDEFEKESTLPGDLETHESLGGATFEFIRTNFSGMKLHDVVYVSANSWFLKLKDEIDSEVYKYVDLQTGEDDIDYVDRDLLIVDPEYVTETALRINERYPDKRLLIHYLQPHHPFIGKEGMDIEQRSQSLIEVVRNNKLFNSESVREAYSENLSIVLAEVEKLLEQFTGRTVITADHGEMLGDRHDYLPVKDYGHYGGVYNRVLTEVPWLVYDTGRRKSVTEEEPINEVHDEVKSRLEKLGYT
ncbi:hypothetical protein [Halovenus halobia]|uniref:hypothetical protein n=1 Tax=Halovenus halobia TaxID=3396622 RepID=UPI003F5722F2